VRQPSGALGGPEFNTSRKDAKAQEKPKTLCVSAPLRLCVALNVYAAPPGWISFQFCATKISCRWRFAGPVGQWGDFVSISVVE